MTQMWFLRGSFHKQCSRCKKLYQVTLQEQMEHFFSPSGKEADGLKHACKRCETDARHGRSRVDVDTMLSEQDHQCYLCSIPLNKNAPSYWCVDHDHENKTNRKLLCKRCNLRMSAVDDNDWLEKAIKYRDQFRASANGGAGANPKAAA